MSIAHSTSMFLTVRYIYYLARNKSSSTFYHRPILASKISIQVDEGLNLNGHPQGNFGFDRFLRYPLMILKLQQCKLKAATVHDIRLGINT